MIKNCKIIQIELIKLKFQKVATSSQLQLQIELLFSCLVVQTYGMWVAQVVFQSE